MKYNYIFKLLLLGEPAVGKTALYHAISEKEIPKRLLSTTGIESKTILEKMSESTYSAINWCDFAGQQAYRDIQKLFFKGDSIYILVLNLRDSFNKNRVDYWLDIIKDKAPRAKILPILAHLDEVKDGVLGLTASEEWEKLQNALNRPRILEPIKVSNIDGTNINKVRFLLEESVR